MTRVRVWDLPTRIFHWALVLAIAFAWGATRWHNYAAHRAAGYTILGLLVFRIIWGFVGSDTSRFTNFVKGPAAAWRYARSLPARVSDEAYGHNPLGAWSVVLMLLALVAQVGLGLFTVDTDGLESGPLSDYVDFDTGRLAAHWHHRMFNVVLALIVLHVAAVLFYAIWKRRNLVKPMITGWMESTLAKSGRFAGLGRAAIVAVIAAGAAWFVSKGLKL